MQKTRVTTAGMKATPVKGSPQPKNDKMARTRVTPEAKEMPRREAPKQTAMDRMGLKIGSRVTRK